MPVWQPRRDGRFWPETALVGPKTATAPAIEASHGGEPIKRHADRHQTSTATLLIGLGEQPVSRDRANQERQEAKVPIAVEAQGCDDQDSEARLVVLGQQVIDA